MEGVIPQAEGECVIVVIRELVDMQVEVRPYEQCEATKALIVMSLLNGISVKLNPVSVEPPADKKGFSE